ncbi:MAG: ribbon-helix-helix domain-containing protein [Spirochaetales bacterium]|nr:ribbon-helix-helix domain-containing protein [Spirochaetales bacterium]
MIKVSTKPISIRLPEDWIDNLKLISSNIGLSSYSEIIRIAVKRYMDEYLDDEEFGNSMREASKTKIIDTDDFISSLGK